MMIMNLPRKMYQRRTKQVKAQRMNLGVTQAYGIGDALVVTTLRQK